MAFGNSLRCSDGIGIVDAAGFEHAVYFTDVANAWVAYVELFGNFRFSVHLGNSCGLEPRAITMNPRAPKTRLKCKFAPPISFLPHSQHAGHSRYPTIMKGVETALKFVLDRWQNESMTEFDLDRNQELENVLAGIKDDPKKQAEQTLLILTKWATVQHGGHWEEELDSEPFMVTP